MIELNHILFANWRHHLLYRSPPFQNEIAHWPRSRMELVIIIVNMHFAQERNSSKHDKALQQHGRKITLRGITKLHNLYALVFRSRWTALELFNSPSATRSRRTLAFTNTPRPNDLGNSFPFIQSTAAVQRWKCTINNIMRLSRNTYFKYFTLLIAREPTPRGFGGESSCGKLQSKGSLNHIIIIVEWCPVYQEVQFKY